MGEERECIMGFADLLVGLAVGTCASRLCVASERSRPYYCVTRIGVNILFGDSAKEESKSIYYDDV